MDSTSDEKKGFRWKRTRHSQRNKQDLLQKQAKQADLKLLQQAAQDRHIELKYLDESGFCLWSPVSYSYSRHWGTEMPRANPATLWESD